MKQLLFLVLALPILAAAQANDGCGAVPYTAAGAFAGSAGSLGTSVGFHFSRQQPIGGQSIYAGLGAEALHFSSAGLWALPLTGGITAVLGRFGICPTIAASGGWVVGRKSGAVWQAGGGITAGNAQLTISYTAYRFAETPVAGLRCNVFIVFL